MRALVCGVIVGLLATVARAQPGQVPPPYAYQPAPAPVMLTAEEQELLLDGEISDAQHAGGVIAAVFAGFGIGQAIEGRWSEKGYIFTVGEGITSSIFIYGFFETVMYCIGNETNNKGCSRGPELMIAGALGDAVFRIWGVIDAVTGPGEHNQRVRALRMRVGGPRPYYGSLRPYVAPSQHGDGAVAGVGFSF